MDGIEGERISTKKNVAVFGVIDQVGFPTGEWVGVPGKENARQWRETAFEDGVLDEAKDGEGTVKLRPCMADWANEKRDAELPRISISARNHQPRRLAVPPFLSELSRC